ncbi:MAG: HD domain-containing protein [Rhodospirillales bacterium]|nr:HD domain-containing protein [Rhodospirillales bacterium]
MQGLRSDIAIVGEAKWKSDNIVSALREAFNLREENLDDCRGNGSSGAHLYVFCTNIGSDENFAQLKTAVKACAGEKMFVLPTHNSKCMTRLRDLGITDYLVQPVKPDELRAMAKKAINRRVERSWAALDPTIRVALKTSLACFEDCYSRVQRGEALPMEEIQLSCQKIRESTKIGTLGSWIDALDDHHNYSFRHSMFVCGILTYFANAIGISGSDLQLLTVGGLLHDVGKSQVPLEILDKPGKLDPQEWELMQNHPEHSREILLREQGLDQDAYAMAVHHHEKLDGTGYPDGLSGAEINDHVRLTTIADIYSALIDKRSYKEAMSKEAALDLMGKFKGHLDLDLLRCFRGFVLDTQ